MVTLCYTMDYGYVIFRKCPFIRKIHVDAVQASPSVERPERGSVWEPEITFASAFYWPNVRHPHVPVPRFNMYCISLHLIASHSPWRWAAEVTVCLADGEGAIRNASARLLETLPGESDQGTDSNSDQDFPHQAMYMLCISMYHRYLCIILYHLVSYLNIS